MITLSLAVEPLAVVKISTESLRVLLNVNVNVQHLLTYYHMPLFKYALSKADKESGTRRFTPLTIDLTSVNFARWGPFCCAISKDKLVPDTWPFDGIDTDVTPLLTSYSHSLMYKGFRIETHSERSSTGSTSNSATSSKDSLSSKKPFLRLLELRVQRVRSDQVHPA